MDTANEPSTLMDSLLPTFAAALTRLRERSRDLLREQDDRLQQFEARLEEQFTAALDQMEQERQELFATELASGNRVESLEKEIRQLQQLRRDSEQALDEAREMLAEMEEERRVLRSRLDEAQPLDRAAGNGDGDSEEVERLQRRLELAMQELRELRARNEELAAQPAQSAVATEAVIHEGQFFDWETQKRRMLERLESSFDSQDPRQAKEKLRCEEIIRATDRALAEKDRELADLRSRLEQQSLDATAAADHATAAAQMLDSDALIQGERARLAQLQAELEEKLRRAEVEISIERAKIARERLQLEEKLRTLPAQGATENGTTAGGDAKAGKGGRWLARLGLGQDKESG